jgi:hypothetical protein
MNGLQYITDPDKRDKRLYAILDKEHRCKEDAALQWKSTQPSDGLLAVVMLATNLVTNSFRLADCVGLCCCGPLDTPRLFLRRRDCASVSDGEVGAWRAFRRSLRRC